MSIEYYIEQVSQALVNQTFEERKAILKRIKEKVIEEIDIQKKIEYILLLSTIELELRKQVDDILLEQKKYYRKYSNIWTDEEKDLWKINYAAFVYDEGRKERKAIKILLSLESHKEYAQKYCLLAQILFYRGDYINAEKNYIKAIKIGLNKKSHTQALLGLGTCYIRNHKYKHAIRVLENTNENWNDEVAIKSKIHLLKAYLKRGKIVEAKNLFHIIKKHRDEIEESFYFKYLAEVIRSMKNMEIVPVCSYIYCARHKA